MAQNGAAPSRVGKSATAVWLAELSAAADMRSRKSEAKAMRVPQGRNKEVSPLKAFWLFGFLVFN